MTSATDGSTNATPTDGQHHQPMHSEPMHDAIEHAAPRNTGTRSPALDSLRALAAFAVLLTHAGDATASDFGRLPFAAGLPARTHDLFGIRFPTGVAIQQLNIGVEIFFVLSALLVYKPFLEAHVLGNKHPEPIRFIWKRAWRIFPAYWVALFTIVVLFASRALNTADQVLTNGLLTWGYGATRWFGGGIGLKQSWTLVVEVSFYAFVPLWAWIMRSIGRRFSVLRVEAMGAFVLTAAGPAFMFFTRGHTPWTPFRVLPPYFGAFGIGMLLACALVAKEQHTTSQSRLDILGRYTIACWAAAAAVFAITIQNVDLSSLAMLVKGSSHQSIERTMHTVVAGLIVTPVVFGLRRESIIGRLLHWRPLAMVGVWSYGFYLWHYAFIDYMHEHRFDINSSSFFVKMVVFATVGAMTAAGAASWYLIERPCLRLGAGQVRRPQWLRWQRPSFYTGLSLITFGALLWRVGYVIANIGRLKLSGDAFYYHTQANDIAAGRWFIDPSQFAWYGRVTPSAGHPPTYLMYLAGVSRWIGQSELTHRLASTLIGAATVFALGMLARKLFDDDRAGWLAAFFGAVYAHLWINDEMLMSETMAQLWTVIAFIAVYRFWRDPRFGTAAWMGAAIGLAALSRAESATLFLLLVIPLVLLLRTLPMKRRISLIVLSCGIGGLMMAPWLLYNVGRFEHPVLMSNGVGSVLMVANCDRTYGTYPVGDDEDPNAYLGYWSVGCAIDGGFTALQKGDESEKEVEWRTVGIDYIGAHKSDYPKMAAFRVARMWDIGFIGQNVFPFNSALEGRGAWPSTLATMQYLVLMPLGLHGLVLLRRRRAPIIPFLAIAGTITFTAATTFGITRYRAPVDALLCALAAGAVITRLDRSKRRTPSTPRAVDLNRAAAPLRPWTFAALIRTPTALFCTVALSLGTLFAIITPAFTGYDEIPHFLRAWQLSNGHIRSEQQVVNGRTEAGDQIPQDLQRDIGSIFATTFNDASGRPARDASRALAHIGDPAPDGATSFAGFAQSAVYAPVPYIPASIAIRVGRAVGLSTLALLWVARLTSLAGYVGLIMLALRFAPRRKWLYATLALIPVIASQSAMVSADGITFALALVAVALAQSLYCRARDSLKWTDAFEIGGVVLALGLSKPPFILLAALFIPAVVKHKQLRTRFRIACALVPGFVSFIAWTNYARSIYLPPLFAFGNGSYAYRGVDADEQFSQLLHHPWSLISVIARTLSRDWTKLLHDVVAQVPGWRPHALVAALIAVAAYVAIAWALRQSGSPQTVANQSERDTTIPLGRGEFAGATATCAAIVLAIFALAYTGWNQVGAPRIDAFQGRYLFGPIAVWLLYLPSRPLRNSSQALQRVPVIAAGAASLITLAGLMIHYY